MTVLLSGSETSAATATRRAEDWARIDRVDNEVRRLVSRNRGPDSTGYQVAFLGSTLWFEQFTAAGGADYIATDVPTEGTPFDLAVVVDANPETYFKFLGSRDVRVRSCRC